MAAATAILSNPLFLTRNPQGLHLSLALSSVSSSINPLDKRALSGGPGKLRITNSITRSPLTVQAAAYSDGGRRPSNASIFVGGFVLGGLIVGALGCVYAPQISKALTGTDRKDLMRKLPKFIYDEEKALEKTRKILAEKIEQLNSAIDDVSSQLRSEDAPNGASVHSDDVEAAI
ncbi:hypothetical protein OIU77_020341 [Salix suchowensis]|uniref:Uncharacterized protein n=1 Tax=Salix suchowensis TaxID=1278906 RepID=A0ABQ9CJC8_9ROSI|nr:Localized to the inner membrane of the chloroplast [Salix suchowensis]KAJ6399767.1 hypothetical protein OIU77_020341 [Salix suchowensis]